MNRSKVQITLYVDSNGTHLHQVFTGLLLLNKAEHIDLILRAGIPITNGRPNRQFIAMDMCSNGVTRRAIFDMQDSSRIGIPSALEPCDFYFKRSLEPETFHEAGDQDRLKIRPFGLNYRVVVCPRAYFLKRLLLEYLSRPYNPLSKKHRFHMSNMKELFDASWRNKKKSVLSPEELSRSATPKTSDVLFQCRLWDPEEVAPRNREDAENVNEQRIDLIRKLKQELGSRFAGGLQHNEYTKRVAPDLLLDSPAMGHRKNYIEAVKGTRIAISSPGLLGSNGGKLGEYMALGKCVLSPAITTVLPGNFSEDVHYKSYRSTDQCLSLVDDLLSKPEELDALSQSAASYYENYIEPAQMMMNHIDTMRS